MQIKSILASFLDPKAKLAEIANSRWVWSSFIIGAGGYYWRTLSISERVLPPTRFDFTFVFVNAIVALIFLGVIAFLIQGAFYLCGYGVKRKLLSIYSLWGWTELPKLFLILGIFYLNYFVPGFLVTVFTNWVWMIGAGALFIIVLVWYLSLKLQALRVCYGVSGKKLIAPGSLLILFYVIFDLFLLSTLEGAAWVRLSALRSMIPTLDLKVVSKPLLLNPYVRIPTIPVQDHRYQFRRGDVVTYARSNKQRRISFRNLIPEPSQVGRIVGLPGETVEVRKAWVMVNEKPLLEPYVKYSQMWDHSAQKVSAHQFFIIGDNRLMTFAKYPGGIVESRDIGGLSTAVTNIIFKFFEPKDEEGKPLEPKEEESSGKAMPEGKVQEPSKQAEKPALSEKGQP